MIPIFKKQKATALMATTTSSSSSSSLLSSGTTITSTGRILRTGGSKRVLVALTGWCCLAFLYAAYNVGYYAHHSARIVFDTNNNDSHYNYNNHYGENDNHEGLVTILNSDTQIIPAFLLAKNLQQQCQQNENNSCIQLEVYHDGILSYYLQTVLESLYAPHLKTMDVSLSTRKISNALEYALEHTKFQNVALVPPSIMFVTNDSPRFLFTLQTQPAGNDDNNDKNGNKEQTSFLKSWTFMFSANNNNVQKKECGLTRSITVLDDTSLHRIQQVTQHTCFKQHYNLQQATTSRDLEYVSHELVATEHFVSVDEVLWMDTKVSNMLWIILHRDAPLEFFKLKQAKMSSIYDNNENEQHENEASGDAAVDYETFNETTYNQLIGLWKFAIESVQRWLLMDRQQRQWAAFDGGLWPTTPFNTLAAAQTAAAQQTPAPMINIDLVISADGELVTAHDEQQFNPLLSSKSLANSAELSKMTYKAIKGSATGKQQRRMLREEEDSQSKQITMPCPTKQVDNDFIQHVSPNQYESYVDNCVPTTPLDTADSIIDMVRDNNNTHIIFDLKASTVALQLEQARKLGSRSDVPNDRFSIRFFEMEHGLRTALAATVIPDSAFQALQSDPAIANLNYYINTPTSLACRRITYWIRNNQSFLNKNIMGCFIIENHHGVIQSWNDLQERIQIPTDKFVPIKSPNVHWGGYVSDRISVSTTRFKGTTYIPNRPRIPPNTRQRYYESRRGLNTTTGTRTSSRRQGYNRQHPYYNRMQQQRTQRSSQRQQHEGQQLQALQTEHRRRLVQQDVNLTVDVSSLFPYHEICDVPRTNFTAWRDTFTSCVENGYDTIHGPFPLRSKPVNETSALALPELKNFTLIKLQNFLNDKIDYLTKMASRLWNPDTQEKTHHWGFHIMNNSSMSYEDDIFDYYFIGKQLQDKPRPKDIEGVYRCATKVFTSMLFLRLQELGLVDMNAPIYPNPGGKIKSLVTLKQIVTNTAGSTGNGNGTYFQYSNEPWFAVEYIVQNATKMSFLDAMRYYIMDPMGIQSGYFDTKSYYDPYTARGFRGKIDDMLLTASTLSSYGVSPRTGKQVLSAESVKDMLTPWSNKTIENFLADRTTQSMYRFVEHYKNKRKTAHGVDGYAMGLWCVNGWRTDKYNNPIRGYLSMGSAETILYFDFHGLVVGQQYMKSRKFDYASVLKQMVGALGRYMIDHTPM